PPSPAGPAQPRLRARPRRRRDLRGRTPVARSAARARPRRLHAVLPPPALPPEREGGDRGGGRRAGHERDVLLPRGVPAARVPIRDPARAARAAGAREPPEP